MIDLFVHCEHLALWGMQQPFNMLSSMGFWLAAWLMYYQYRPKLWTYPFWLIAGIEVIGWASLLWHATHEALGVVLDVGSIICWLVFFAAFVGHKKFHWPYYKGALLGALFLLLSLGLGRIMSPWVLQTTGALLPLTVLLFWAGWHTKNRWWIYSATSLILALIMRMVDIPLCSLTPWGTHWLWHVGCAFSLYAALHAMLGRPKTSLP